VTDLAAWAPIVDEHNIDFVSARLRNYQALEATALAAQAGVMRAITKSRSGQ
jgi:hypothetical protein